MGWTYEYDLLTGFISGAVDNIIPLTQQPSSGRGYFRDNDDFKSNVMVDITQNPPVLITAPTPATPPADMITLIFNALIQQGWINPSTVDSTIIDRANASLAITGAKTISTVSTATIIG